MTTTTTTTSLKPGFELRPLDPSHLDWVKAIMSHCMVYESPVWSVALAPATRTPTVYSLFHSLDAWVLHGLTSGLSYGVFDTSHRANTPGAAALRWDFADPAASSDALVAGMDFPLVSVALAYDGFRPVALADLAATSAALPGIAGINAALAARDPRPPASWQPTAAGQVMYRNATSTRADYAGKGLMKMVAYALMREAKERGFRAIKIECFNEILPRVWARPPAPFRAEVVSEVEAEEVVEVGEDGVERWPLKGVKQRMTRIHVDL